MTNNVWKMKKELLYKYNHESVQNSKNYMTFYNVFQPHTLQALIVLDKFLSVIL
jgi:hypothetical protein